MLTGDCRHWPCPGLAGFPPPSRRRVLLPRPPTATAAARKLGRRLAEPRALSRRYPVTPRAPKRSSGRANTRSAQRSLASRGELGLPMACTFLVFSHMHAPSSKLTVPLAPWHCHIIVTLSPPLPFARLLSSSGAPGLHIPVIVLRCGRIGGRVSRKEGRVEAVGGHCVGKVPLGEVVLRSFFV